MINGIHLDYKELRSISPEAARKAILQVLKSTNRNISETAKLLHVSRRTIYKTVKKDNSGDLNDSSRAPRARKSSTACKTECYC